MLLALPTDTFLTNATQQFQAAAHRIPLRSAPEALYPAGAKRLQQEQEHLSNL
jgi:hypothetical protein